MSQNLLSPSGPFLRQLLQLNSKSTFFVVNLLGNRDIVPSSMIKLKEVVNVHERDKRQDDKTQIIDESFQRI